MNTANSDSIVKQPLGIPKHGPSYKIGDTLIVVSECYTELANPWQNKFLQLSQVQQVPLVHLTITETKVVPGNYHPDQAFWGFLAQGSDGWVYECQWDYFDEAATSPHQNWQRQYTEGVHYDKVPRKENGSAIEFRPEHKADFARFFLAWELRRTSILHVPKSMPQQQAVVDALVARVNREWPDCALALCPVLHTTGDTTETHGASLGYHRVSHGCPFCNMDRQDAHTRAYQSKGN